MTEQERDLAEWDAEIEADFQRAVAATKQVGKRKRGHRHIGFPLAFLADVCRLTEGRATLVVAVLIYRRTKVCNSRTVTLPGHELADLGIDRSVKRKALVVLQEAGLVRVDRQSSGRTIKVTLTWQPG